MKRVYVHTHIHTHTCACTHTHIHTKHTCHDASWSYLEIHSEMEGIPDEEVAYSAGLLEGMLTGDLIYMHWMNIMDGYCAEPSTYCTNLENFITDNAEFMTQQIADNKTSFWYQVQSTSNTALPPRPPSSPSQPLSQSSLLPPLTRSLSLPASPSLPASSYSPSFIFSLCHLCSCL